MKMHVFPTTDTWASAVAHAIVDTLREAIEARGQAFLVLSGGRTPRPVYALLAKSVGRDLPWSQVQVFWGDERYVPADDPRSNYRMARETFLRWVPLPPENVHPMPTFLRDPDLAAQAYEATLRSFFSEPWPRFDLVLLGLGSDGHTASLFPGSPALAERKRWVVATPAADVTRLTLTFPAINHARQIFFLVTGAAKAHIVSQVMRCDEGVQRYPACGIRPVHGDLTWWLDDAAAREVATESDGA